MRKVCRLMMGYVAAALRFHPFKREGPAAFSSAGTRCWGFPLPLGNAVVLLLGSDGVFLCWGIMLFSSVEAWLFLLLLGNNVP